MFNIVKFFSLSALLLNAVHAMEEKNITIQQIIEHGSQFNAALYEENGKPFILTAITGDTVTQLGIAIHTQKLSDLLNDAAYWDNKDNSTFHKLKELGNFFPIRHKLPGYLQTVHGWHTNFQDLVNYDTRHAEQKTLSSKGDSTLLQYTSDRTSLLEDPITAWISTRINLLLSTDNIGDNRAHKQALLAKDLKAVIGWQTPKWQGVIFRGALHSPLELFTMAYKRYFYIPSFVSAARSWKGKIFLPYPNENARPKTNYQNVVFAIDTTDFPNFSTIIQKHQTRYPGETESLLSCYNIFSWQGLRLIKDLDKENNEIIIPVVMLKVENYELLNNFNEHKVDSDPRPIPATWMKKRNGQLVKTRHVSSYVLRYNLKLLFESYEIYAKKNGLMELDWLNADFDNVSSEVPTLKGREINSQELDELVKKQQLQKELHSNEKT